MDPDAVLKQVLKDARNVLHDYDSEKKLNEQQAVDIANAIVDLHNWLRRGGFIPSLWVVKK